jgi:hypothetical protein
MTTIKAPIEGYNERIGDVLFKDSVAETDNIGVIMYCRSAGYEVDGTVDNPAARPLPAVDSSKTHQMLGTQLRDAAVDPQPADFLPPVNAGQADPHGPEVVAPGLHAAPPGPIVPGLVADEAATQQDLETDAARRVLVDQQPVPAATADLAKANTADSSASVEVPAGNASQETWAGWVIATHPELDADSVRQIKRDDLREQYGPKES